jgi:transcriptional regulator with XRE-family HTH domain
MKTGDLQRQLGLAACALRRKQGFSQEAFAAMSAATPIQRQAVGMAFGAVLRCARRVRGVTQEQLAEASGIDDTFVGLLERGLRTPTLTVIFRIAHALGIEAEQLIAATAALLRTSARSRSQVAASLLSVPAVTHL